MYIAYNFNVDWSIYHSIMKSLFENYRKKLGNYGGISGKFLKEVLEVFEELLAHA